MAEVKMMDWIPFPKEGEPQNFYQTEKNDFEEVKEILGIDSSVEDEPDEEFDKWVEELSRMSEEDAKNVVWEKFKSQITDDDLKCCERIIEILNDPKNKNINTDLVFIENELKKINSDINPITVLNYLLMLQGLKLISLQQ